MRGPQFGACTEFSSREGWFWLLCLVLKKSAYMTIQNGASIGAFTIRSGQTLFAEVFGENNVMARGRGNVLVAISSLMGLAQQDLERSELDYIDPDYPLNIAVRAVKR